jgi:SSS family solute:Na+ symporter
VVAGIVIAVGVLGCLAMTAGGFDSDAIGLPGTHMRIAGGIGPLGWIGLMLPPFLLMIGDANLMQRFLAADSPRTARRAAWGTLVGLLVLESAIIALALIGRARLEVAPLNPAHVIVDVAFNLVPPFLGAMLAAAIVAVVLSTADSFLLACSTSAASDFNAGGEDSAAPSSPKKHRISVLIFGLVALGLAYTSDSFFDVALYAYTLYGVTLTPAVVAAIFFPRTHPKAVVGGMLGGLGTALAWKFFSLAEGSFEGLDPVLPALLLNVLILLLLQICLPNASRKSLSPKTP